MIYQVRSRALRKRIIGWRAGGTRDLTLVAMRPPNLGIAGSKCHYKHMRQSNTHAVDSVVFDGKRRTFPLKWYSSLNMAPKAISISAYELLRHNSLTQGEVAIFRVQGLVGSHPILFLLWELGTESQ
jgi:hypothetical protein